MPPTNDEDCDRRIGDLDRDLREARHEHKRLDSRTAESRHRDPRLCPTSVACPKAVATRFGRAAETEL
jgi:hypothetical protein